MMARAALLASLFGGATAVASAGGLPAQDFDLTALDEYVAAPDDNYGWVDLNETVRGPGWTGYLLNMTSQAWLTSADWEFASPSAGASPVWWHYLAIVVPDNYGELAPPSFGGLWITGGSNTDGLPKATDEDMLVTGAFATGTGCIMGALFQVPNEHIVFASDPLQKSRSEDAIIAFTWDHFVTKDPSNPEWLLRLPMTKAAVRAMDTVEAWVAQRDMIKGGGKHSIPVQDPKISKWLVAGASKRGWTTWTTAAVVPDRVVAAVPIVLDVAELVPNMHHQWRAFGGWTWAFKDYYEMNFTRQLDNPNTALMCDVVDPFSYFDRLTMPKLVVNTGMDEFMMLDDDRVWWDALPEPKHRLLLPNTEHSCATGIFEIVPSVVAWANQLITEQPVPFFNWTLAETETDASITVYAGAEFSGGVEPLAVRAWVAPSACDGVRRDWRILSQGPEAEGGGCPCGVETSGQCLNLKSFWHSELLAEDPARPGVYEATRPAPASGWTGFFVDVTYETTAYPPAASAAAYEASLAALAESAGASPKRALIRDAIAAAANRAAAGAAASPIETWPVDNRHLEFTTQAAIVPSTFPFDDCAGEDCYGTLV